MKTRNDLRSSIDWLYFSVCNDSYFLLLQNSRAGLIIPYPKKGAPLIRFDSDAQGLETNENFPLRDESKKTESKAFTSINPNISYYLTFTPINTTRCLNNPQIQ